jgi:fermentation-respiration switch protein FrsA (DUF1100 family)
MPTYRITQTEGWKTIVLCPQSFLVAVLLFLLCGCLAGCTGLPFHPTKTVLVTPKAIGLSYEDVRIRTDDGQSIAGWFLPAPVSNDTRASSLPADGRTLLFLHGNAGNISHRLDSLAYFHLLGFAVLIIDYRGYGQSTGKPSVKGTLTDARAAWDWLLAQKGLPPASIVIFGRSLGGAIAAGLAGEVRPGALIMESSFTSMYDVAKRLYPFLPVSLFLPQDYDSAKSLRDGSFPLLVVHSADDELIPYALGETVFNAYGGPKQFLRISGSHNAGFQTDKTRYLAGLESFLQSLPRMAK